MCASDQYRSGHSHLCGGSWGGGSGGSVKSCSNEGTVFCSHRNFNLNTGCHCDDIKGSNEAREVTDIATS